VRDHSLELRKALVALLRANAGVVGLVPAARIYGERPKDKDPVWPYILIGVVIAGPHSPSGVNGSDASLAIHCFAPGPTADAAYRINKAVVAAVDEKRLDLGGVAIPRVAVASTQVIPDAGSPKDWHGLVNISALTAEAA
jgi:hypothetical protein